MAGSFLLSPQSAQAGTYTYTNTATASTWANNANWTGSPGSEGPTTAGDVDNVNFTLTGTTTIGIASTGDGVPTKTVGILNIGDAGNKYLLTLAPGGTGGALSLNNNGAGAQINQVSTAFGVTISAPIAIADSNSTTALTISNASTTSFIATGGISGTGNLVLDANSTGEVYVNSAATFSGSITNSGTGTGIGSFASVNTASATNTSTTSPLKMGTVTVVSSGTTFTLAGGGAGTITASGESGTGNFTLDINAASSGGITLNTANNVGIVTNSGTGAGTSTFSGQVGANVTGVYQNSATSVLALNGANTFTSNVYVENGGIFSSAAAATGTGTNVFGFGSIYLGYNATGNINATVTYGGAGTVTSPITVVAGSTGTLTIAAQSSSNAYSSAITENNALTLDEISTGKTVTFSGPITGSSPITTVGSGYVALTDVGNSTTFTGNINVASGTLQFANGGLGSGNINFTGGALQYPAADTVDISPQIATSTGDTGAVKIDVNGNTVIFGTPLSSSITNGLTLTSSTAAGVLVLTGANAYTGQTTVTSGTLQLAPSATLSSGDAVSTAATGIFDLDGNSQTFGTVVNAGLITNSSMTPVTLNLGGATSTSGAGSFTGAMNIVLNSTGTATTALGIVNAAGSITDSNTSTGNGTITTVGANVTGITQASNTSNLVVTTLNATGTGNTQTVTSTGSASFVASSFTGTGSLLLDANATGTIAISAATNAGLITNSGSGTGTVSLGSTANTSLSSNITGIVQNSATSVLVLPASQTSSFASGITIDNGTLVGQSGTAFGAATNTIALGATGGSNSATLTLNATGNATYNAYPVTLGTTAGILTISGGSANFPGTISGSNNLTFYNTDTSGNSLNFAGLVNVGNTITNTGPGTFPTALSGGVSSGVSSIIQNSNSAPLTIGSATGVVTLGSAGLTITSNSTAASAYTTVQNVTGTGNIILNANGAGTFGVGAPGINNTGSLLNSGTGTGGTNITGNIGSNVTTVTEASANSYLSLGGSNTFTGGVTVNSGQLNVNSAYALSSGPLILNGGNLGTTGATEVPAISQIWNADFSFNATAITNTLNMGTGNVNLGTVTLGTPAVVGARTVTFNNAGSLVLNGIVSNGTQSSNPVTTLIKAGSGTLALNNVANTFTNLTVDGGFVEGSPTLNGGATLSGNYNAPTTFGTPFGNGVITLNAGGLNLQFGNSNSNAGYVQLSNNIVMAGNGSVLLAQGSKRDGILSGLISGNGLLTVSVSNANVEYASGILNNTNTYSGGTNLDTNSTAGSVGFSAGAVNALGGGAGGTGGVVTFVNASNVATQATSYLGLAANQSVAGISNASTNTNGLGADYITGGSASSLSTLTINNSSGGAGDGSVFSGSIGGTTIGLGPIASGTAAGNNIALVKSGTGTQILSGISSTFTGGTTIAGGNLQINNASGSALGTGSAALGSATDPSATLSGTGYSSGLVTVTNGGRIAPGTNGQMPSGATYANFGSTGVLTIGSTGGLTLTSANLDFDLNTTPSGSNDLISTGALSLTSVAVTFNGLNGSVATGTPYVLIHYTSTGASDASAFTNTTFVGSLASGGYSAIYSLDTTNDNVDVTFSSSATPEPASLSLLALGGLTLMRRRRKSGSAARAATEYA